MSKRWRRNSRSCRSRRRFKSASNKTRCAPPKSPAPVAVVMLPYARRNESDWKVHVSCAQTRATRSPRGSPMLPPADRARLASGGPQRVSWSAPRTSLCVSLPSIVLVPQRLGCPVTRLELTKPFTILVISGQEDAGGTRRAHGAHEAQERRDAQGGRGESGSARHNVSAPTDMSAGARLTGDVFWHSQAADKDRARYESSQAEQQYERPSSLQRRVDEQQPRVDDEEQAKRERTAAVSALDGLIA